MREQMKSAGFLYAYASCFHSFEFDYLGSEQFTFASIK